MAKYKLKIDDGCISCGNCANVCPEFFEMKDKSSLKIDETDELKCAKEAAEQCPVNVIHIVDTETDETLI